MKDFFISYHTLDRQWAEWIAWHLEETGYSVVKEAADFKRAINCIRAMQRAATEANCIIPLLSPDYLTPRFSAELWDMAFTKDPTGEQGLLLPVRIQQFASEALSHRVVYIDLANLTEAKAKNVLLAGIQHGRSKPEVAPHLPGNKEHHSNTPPHFPDRALPTRTSGLATQQRSLLNDIPNNEVDTLQGSIPFSGKANPVSRRDETEILDDHVSKTGYVTERYTKINFPAECLLEQKVYLHVQLTAQPDWSSRVLKKLRVGFPADVDNVVLDVHITAPAFALQSYHQSLSVPKTGDSEDIVFTLIPLELGAQPVEIEFFYKGKRIGYALVNTHVNKKPNKKRATGAKMMEEPLIGLARSTASVSSAVRRTLHVTSSSSESKFSYTVYSPNSQDCGEWEQQIALSDPQITDYLRRLNEFVAEMVTFDSPDDGEWEGICSTLQGIGYNLFKRLVPLDISNMVPLWEVGSTLIISTNEQWVPWELLHDGEMFWSAKFRLVRNARMSDRKKMPQHDRPLGFINRNLRGIINAVGGNIPAVEAKKATQLFASFSFSPSPIVLEQQPLAALKTALAGAGIVHFTCHGHQEPHMLQINANKLMTQNLLPTTIDQLPLEPGCLVFANACSSDVPTLSLGKMESFGWEFYRRGADAFVGTLGTIPTEQAILFAEAVYKELFRTDKKITLAEAIASAKQAAQEKRNLFWLLYCVYGNPDFTVSQPT